MKLLYIAIILMLGTLFFQSCSSCTRTYNITCTNGTLQMLGTGFDSSDFDAAITIRYKQDNAFDSIIDTLQTSFAIWNSDTCQFNMADSAELTKLDTILVNQNQPSPYCTPGYDYKVLLPAAGKTYLITKITQSGTTTYEYTHVQVLVNSGPGRPCFNNVISCYINDTINACTQNVLNSVATFCVQK